MFGLFKKKSEKEKLQKKYKRLLKESYELSKTNRKESDKKAYEADLIAKEIDALSQGLVCCVGGGKSFVLVVKKQEGDSERNCF